MMISDKFLSEFRRTTEKKWSETRLDSRVYGFQIQPGTRWNPGMTDEKITEYENFAEVCFPHDFRKFLGSMNGTDKETINIYGSSDYPASKSVGVYSYPRDMKLIRERLEDVYENRHGIVKDLAEQGFDLFSGLKLVPIYGHRYVVCTPDLDTSLIVSFAVSDTILYGNTLEEYLKKEFLEC
jgi:hypothetical protein